MSKGNRKIPDLTEATYMRMLDELYTKILEERDLSLDRYRLQDEMIENADDFILQGKNAISFLNHASSRTDALFNISKEIKEIAFKNADKSDSSSSSNFSDEKRRALATMIKANKNKKEDLTNLEHDEDLINKVKDDDE